MAILEYLFCRLLDRRRTRRDQFPRALAAQDARVPVHEVPELGPHAVPALPDGHGVHHTAEEQLLVNQFRVDLVGHLFQVRLHAANVVWIRRGDFGHEELQRILETRGDGQSPLRFRLLQICFPGLFAPELEADVPEDLELRARDEVRKGIGRLVGIFVAEALAGVHHVPRVVLHAEGDEGVTLRLDEAGVGAIRLLNFCYEHLVCRIRERDHLGQHRKDARLAVDQRKHVGVVRKLDLLVDNDALAVVIIEFSLEDAGVEMLLQVLVAEVNQELLQRVRLEGFEPGNVQHSDHPGVVVFLLLRLRRQVRLDSPGFVVECVAGDESQIHPLQEPKEEPAVDEPADGVTQEARPLRFRRLFVNLAHHDVLRRGHGPD
mmetsp:Transcript_83476/g.232882  ORF Transcript_83476/g.232882 Transcript_83476/m.232882 type:complete len:376 (-) Transcript_83476:1132-2259(-)